MNKYVVATVSFFENEIKQTVQFSEDELGAFKKHMFFLATNKEEEQQWQNDEDYPKTYNELLEEISNWDMDCNVLIINNKKWKYQEE